MPEKIHYAVKGMSGNTKSLCGRSSGLWINVEEITTGQNLTRDPDKVTCSFCKNILPRRLEHERNGRFKDEDAMPLTAKGEKIMAAMKKQYGEQEGERVFYASKNKGKITGVDSAPVGNKITREAFIFLSPKPRDNEEILAQCSSCRMFVPDIGRCIIHGSFIDIDKDDSCGFWVGWPTPNGKPNPNVVADHKKELLKNIPGSVTPDESGLVDEKVQCHRCKFFNADTSICGLYDMLNKQSPDIFALEVKVTTHSCCNAWTSASVTVGDAVKDTADDINPHEIMDLEQKIVRLKLRARGAASVNDYKHANELETEIRELTEQLAQMKSQTEDANDCGCDKRGTHDCSCGCDSCKSARDGYHLSRSETEKKIKNLKADLERAEASDDKRLARQIKGNIEYYERNLEDMNRRTQDTAPARRQRHIHIHLS